MSDDRSDATGFRPSSEPPVAAFRSLLELLLGKLGEAWPSDPDYQESVAACRDALRNARSTGDVRDLATALLALLGEALSAVRRLGGNAVDLTAVIHSVHDAIVTVANDEEHLKSGLRHTAARFAALREIQDLAQIRARLTEEVSALTRLTDEREAKWHKVLGALKEKIAALEGQALEHVADATHDELTGVANRRNIASRFAACQKQRRQLVLAVFDLDDFKRINDAHGHQRGDAILRTVASLLQTSVRPQDLVGRVGGDEFVVLMLDVMLPQAEQRCRTIVRAIEQALAAEDIGSAGRLSCGVAEYSAGDTLESLLQRADQALYEAKRLGKNRVVAKDTPYLRDLR